MAEKPAFSGPFAPSEADLSRCVHCGLCLQHCPTYTELGLESESPRGRLYLIRAISEGHIQPTPATTGHLDLCHQCRNCEAVCPSGVPYGRIMEGARAELLAGAGAPLAWRLRALFLRQVIARPGRLALLALLLRLYRASGLRWLAERTPLLRDHVLLAPTISGRPFRQRGVLARPQGPLRQHVALLTGCIMPLAYGRVHEATVRVLARNGCEVIAPPEQACCGALHAHNGDRPTAMALARRNIDAFLAAGVDAVVVNSAGCGAAMKEYGELLADDPAYAEKAQRIQAAPRVILNAIAGLRLIEMEHPDRCCGSAGVYSLTQREMSLRLLEGKMEDVARTGAGVIATANPGCMAQLEAGLRRHRLPGRVVHVIELLDEAYDRSGQGV